MKSIQILAYSAICLFAPRAQARTTAGDDLTAAWSDYKDKYSSEFRSLGEDDTRFKLFSETFDEVKKHNQKFEKSEVTSKLGINEFAAWTPGEKAKLLGGVAPAADDSLLKGPSVGLDDPSFRALETDLPASIDYRDAGYVSSVKHQIGVLEGQLYKRQLNNDLVLHKVQSLSAQQLADCADVPKCCDESCGQNPATIMNKYLTKASVVREKAYPYVGTRGECKLPNNTKGLVQVNAAGYVKPQQSDEAVMKALIKIGPLSVLVNASLPEFYNHKEGVADLHCAGDGVNHAVLLVGYGTDDKGRKYWIIKNSYGAEQWGEGGYIRMFMNNNSCGVSSYASYAILA